MQPVVFFMQRFDDLSKLRMFPADLEQGNQSPFAKDGVGNEQESDES